MFINDLVNVMTGDPSVNALATGGIRYEHLPTDFDNTKDWITFSYSAGEVERTLDGGVISRYGLQTQINSPSLDNVLIIWNKLKPYLTSYDDRSKIRDIYFIDEEASFSTEKKVYYLTANYSILYIG